LVHGEALGEAQLVETKFECSMVLVTSALFLGHTMVCFCPDVHFPPNSFVGKVEISLKEDNGAKF
jgi:hypothetical protein